MALAGASFDCLATARLVIPRLSVAAFGLTATQELAKPPTPEAKDAATALPRFEDYPSTVVFSGRLGPVVLEPIERGFVPGPRRVQTSPALSRLLLGAVAAVAK